MRRTRTNFENFPQAMDVGKAVAGLLTNAGTPMDFVEIYGSLCPHTFRVGTPSSLEGLKITKPSVPLICVPTTAGTGTEVTRNAVLFLPKEKVKVSIRSQLSVIFSRLPPRHLLYVPCSLVPTVAIIDPLLTAELPQTVTAYSGRAQRGACTGMEGEGGGGREERRMTEVEWVRSASSAFEYT